MALMSQLIGNYKHCLSQFYSFPTALECVYVYLLASSLFTGTFDYISVQFFINWIVMSFCVVVVVVVLHVSNIALS